MSALTDLFTNIANAIRTKKGTTDTILASDFATEITNLPSGGGDFAGMVSGTATSVTIPSGATAIRYAAFYKYANLVSVTMPNTVTSIGDYAFQDCTSLASVLLSTSLTSIAYQAFTNCTNLTSVSIPSGVTSIEDNAFYGCTSLANITIPNSVTSIGGGVFISCTSLKTVTLENGFNCDRLRLPNSPLTVDTMVSMFNALADRTSLTAYMLVLGSTNLEKLTDAQKAIATQKNWTLV